MKALESASAAVSAKQFGNCSGKVNEISTNSSSQLGQLNRTFLSKKIPPKVAPKPKVYPRFSEKESDFRNVATHELIRRVASVEVPQDLARLKQSISQDLISKTIERKQKLDEQAEIVQMEHEFFKEKRLGQAKSFSASSLVDEYNLSTKNNVFLRTGLAQHSIAPALSSTAYSESRLNELGLNFNYLPFPTKSYESNTLPLPMKTNALPSSVSSAYATSPRRNAYRRQNSDPLLSNSSARDEEYEFDAAFRKRYPVHAFPSYYGLSADNKLEIIPFDLESSFYSGHSDVPNTNIDLDILSSETDFALVNSNVLSTKSQMPRMLGSQSESNLPGLSQPFVSSFDAYSENNVAPSCSIINNSCKGYMTLPSRSFPVHQSLPFQTQQEIVSINAKGYPTGGALSTPSNLLRKPVPATISSGHIDGIIRPIDYQDNSILPGSTKIAEDKLSKNVYPDTYPRSYSANDYVAHKSFGSPHLVNSTLADCNPNMKDFVPISRESAGIIDTLYSSAFPRQTVEVYTHFPLVSHNADNSFATSSATMVRNKIVGTISVGPASAALGSTSSSTLYTHSNKTDLGTDKITFFVYWF